jgi:hypothetical protein
MGNNEIQNTIGILYPGEMGSALGKLLAENGLHVLTTVAGRSPRTQALCRAAGLPAVGSLRELLDASQMVISVVSPASALPVARTVAAAVGSRSPGLVYVDANSISPVTAVEISSVLGAAGVEFVDACIFGLASQIRQRGMLYLSGSRAAEVESQLKRALPIRIAGDVPGQASAFKMIVSAVPKGLVALFAEVMLFAQDLRVLSQATAFWDEFYPGLMEVVRRLLPTYPQHAKRRVQELWEVEHTMTEHGSVPHMLSAARAVTESFSGIAWPGGPESQTWTVAEIIDGMRKDREEHGSDKKAHRVVGH